MGKKWSRYRYTGGDDVILEVKRLGFPVGWNMSYVPVANLSSARNKKEQQIVKKLKELEKFLTELKSENDQLAADKAEAKAEGSNYLGIGEPFLLDSKFIKSIQGYIARPQGDWRKILDKAYLNKMGLGEKQVNPKKDKASSRGTKTTYTTLNKEKLKENGLHIRSETGADEVVSFKEPGNRKDSDKNPDKGKLKQLRKENPKYEDESHKEYEQRMKDMAGA